MQLDPCPGKGGAGPANPASRRRSRPGKRLGWTTSSRRGGRGPEWRQGGGRRRGPAAASGGGRGGLVNDGEGVKLVATSELGSVTGAY
jgi:hypothetical protein